MKKLILFNLISLDGFFEGPNHDISWHNVDDEFNQFAAKQMQDTGTILFGKTTYELMRDFWPDYQPEDELNTIIRDKMDMLPKIVYSKTMQSVEENENWKNITLLDEVNPEEVKERKEQDGKSLMMLGSANLADTFFKLGLIDEIRLLVNPVVLGKGTPHFKEGNHLKLTLLSSKTFHNGNVLLCYQPRY